MVKIKLFSSLYNKMLKWANNKHAQYYLAGISFIEASVFPIPPDVMLISMGLARPKLSWRYATIATFFSVLGGAFGYVIGLYAFDLIQPNFSSSMQQLYVTVSHLFDAYGVWIVILAGVTPIPYKMFTLAAGAMHMMFIPFVLASIIGRALRFYLVASLFYFAGAKIEKNVRKYIDWIGSGLLLLLFIIFCLIKWVV